MSLSQLSLSRWAGLAWVAGVFMLFLCLCPTLSAGEKEDAEEKKAENLAEALKNGTFAANLRYRYEFVSDDAFDDDAHASTLRTAVTSRPDLDHRPGSNHDLPSDQGV